MRSGGNVMSRNGGGGTGGANGQTPNGSGMPTSSNSQFRHFSCDLLSARGDDWLGIERVRTEAALLAETARFMEKDWLPATNWPDVLRRYAERVEGSTGGQQTPP